MNRYIATLLIVCTTARILPADTAPTDYIMQFLSKSTTLWRASDDWKTEMQNATAEAETTYAGAQERDFARTRAKGDFKIHKDGNMVEVTAEIEETEVNQAQTDSEFERFKTIAEDINNKKTAKRTDTCSTCNYVIHALIDAHKRQLKITLNSNCTSKIPYEQFMQQIATSMQK